MLARCTKDPTHARFVTTAHVVEEWVVDSRGEFIESVQCLETTEPPNLENVWTCAVCGADVDQVKEVKRLRLTLDVSYDEDTFSRSDARLYLSQIAKYAADKGLFTGETPMEVDAWDYRVENLPDKERKE